MNAYEHLLGWASFAEALDRKYMFDLDISSERTLIPKSVHKDYKAKTK